MYRSLRDCIISSTHAHFFFSLFDEILYKIYFFKKIKEAGKLYYVCMHNHVRFEEARRW